MRKKVLFMLSSMNIGGVEKSFLSLVSRLNPEKYRDKIFINDLLKETEMILLKMIKEKSIIKKYVLIRKIKKFYSQNKKLIKKVNKLESVNLKWKLAQESVKRYLEWFKKYFISKKNSTKKHRCLCSKKYSF